MAEDINSGFGDAGLPKIPTEQELDQIVPLPDDFIEKPGAMNLPHGTTGVSELPTSQDIKDYLANSVDLSKAENPFLRHRPENFDAGLDGYQFERYYSHPKFDDLGFSPYRDNEAIYNENSHAGHEMMRALPQWGNLVGLAFKDALSFGSLTDQEVAKGFEDAMKIGSTTKGGLTGFTTNLFLNSGYTFGIIGELLLEEAALLGITALTGGAAAEAAIPIGIARGARAAKNLGKTWHAGANILRSLDNLKDVNKARKYFNNAVAGAAKFANPLENTADFLSGYEKIKDLDNLAKTSAGFASFYRDIRNIRYAYGEAGLEGGMVVNDKEKELYKAFVDKYGRQPNAEEAESIKETARDAGLTAAMFNLPTILYSNKIVLKELTRPGYKALGRWSKTVGEGSKHGKTVFSKAAGNKPFVFAENNWKSLLNTAKDPKAYAKGALLYTERNIMEGVQETLQETFAGASKDYYTAPWEATPLKGGYLSYVADNLKKQVTSIEGLEVFASGFLMGGMVGPVVKAPQHIISGYKRFSNPEKFEEERRKDKERRDSDINKLNDLWQKPALYKALIRDLDNLNTQAEYANGMEKAKADNNEKAYYDLADASYHEHIFTALDKGVFDLFIERLNEFKSLSPEESAELSGGLDHETFLGNIDKAIQRAKKIEARYDLVQKEFQNPFREPNGVEDENREQDSMYDSWRNAQKQLMFMHYSFDRHLERIESLQRDVIQDSGLAELAPQDFTNLYTFQELEDELSLLNEEIKAYEGVKDADGKRQKKLKEQKRAHLEKFKDAMANLNDFITEDTDGNIVIDQSPEGKKLFNKAKDVYRRYLRHLTGDRYYAFDDALDKSFVKLVDIYINRKNAQDLNESINLLTNPNNFMNIVERGFEFHKLRDQQRQREWGDSLDAFQKSKYLNAILENLYKNYNVFIDPEQLAALVEEGEFPEGDLVFFDATEQVKGEIKPLYMGDPKWNAAKNYLEQAMDKLLDIPIPEVTKDAFAFKYRFKNKNDKRTLKDLAAEYGFNIEEDTQDISLKDLLKKVADNEFATSSESFLAESLSKIISSDDLVTISKTLSLPIVLDEEGKLSIDPRYSSDNYVGGVLPFELIALRATMTRIARRELEKDGEFKRKIDNLLNATNAKWEETREAKDKEPKGFQSSEDFVVEAMLNSDFQKLLAGIESTSENGISTAWKNFVRAIMNLLKSVGLPNDGTALNEALSIITTEIDNVYGTELKSAVGKQPIPQAKAPKQFTIEEHIDERSGAPKEALKKALRAKDWTPKDWKNLSPQELVDIGNIPEETRPTPEEWEEGVAIKGAIIGDLAAARETIDEQLEGLFASAKTMDDVYSVENEQAVAFLAEQTNIKDENGLNMTHADILEKVGVENPTRYLRNLANQTKKDLINRFEESDVKEGMVVKLKKGKGRPNYLKIESVSEGNYIGVDAYNEDKEFVALFNDIEMIKTDVMDDITDDQIDDIDTPDPIDSADSTVSDQSVQNADTELTEDEELEKLKKITNNPDAASDPFGGINIC